MRFAIGIFLFISANLQIWGTTSRPLYIEKKKEALVQIESKFNLPFFEDFEIARETAKQTKKPLLLFFLGDPWCPWSEKLFYDVVRKEDFLKELLEKVIFVKVALPQEVNELSSNRVEKRLKEKYEIQECPTVLLLDWTEEEIVKEGFFPFSPSEYAKHFKDCLHEYSLLKAKMNQETGKVLSESELKELYLHARSFGFKKVKDEILQLGLSFTKSPFFYLEKYEHLSQTRKRKDPELLQVKNYLMGLDPKNEQKVQLRLAIIDFQTRVLRAKSKDRSIRVIKPLKRYLEQFGKKDKENAWKVYLMISQYLFTKNFTKYAIKYAKLSYEIAPQDAKEELQQTLDYLTQQLSSNP